MTPDVVSGIGKSMLETEDNLLGNREAVTRTSPPCSRTKPTSFLKHTHSLEIPDLESDAMPSMVDFTLDSAVPSGFLQNNSVQDDDSYEWMSPEFVSTGADELDEIIAATLCPSFPKPEIISSEPPSGSPCSDRSQGRKRYFSRKEQIQDLRNTVSELSQKLQVLLEVSSTRSPAVCEATQQVTSILVRPQSLWEHVAARQLKLRCKTEEENDKLKDLMSSQRRTARNIRRMIRRRTDDELLEELRNSKRPKLENTEQAFEELLHGIDEIYVTLDTFYEEKDMISVPCPGTKQRVYPDAANGNPFVEFSDKNLVPFSFDRAENAVWKFLQGPRVRGQAHVCSKEFQQTTETSKSCVGFTCADKGLTTYVLEQRVARKFVEENRTVFISRTTAVPTTDKLWFSSLRFSETLRIVVRVGSPLSSGQMTTIIESHLSVSRYSEGCDPSVERHWPAYVNLAASGWERKVSFNNQEIENLLFKESIEARGLERKRSS